MGVETAVAVAAIASVAATGYSAYSSHQQQKEAKKQQRQAQEIQKEQEKEALTARKELIDQQRESLTEGYRTKTTQTPQASGLTGRLENDILG